MIYDWLVKLCWYPIQVVLNLDQTNKSQLHTPCLERYQKNVGKYIREGLNFCPPSLIGRWRCADIWAKWFSIWIKFALPTIIKNVRIVNMCFWEIIPSSLVSIKDYEGYDEVSKLAMYWSSQSSEVSTFSVLQNSLWSLFKGAHYLWLLLCLLGELGWVWVSWVSRRDLGELGELGWVTWVTFLFGSWRL